MATKDETLKMAIDFLDGSYEAHKVRKACQEALEQPSVAQLNDEYLRDTHVAGLEQPAQEPVAWMKNALDNARDVCKYLDHDMIKEAKAHTKFFWNDLDKIRDFDDTHPAPSWVGLSDDENEAIIDSIWVWGNDFPYDEYRVCIEQALRNKNDY